MTDRFSERHGHRRPAPPRLYLEEAPEDLRVVLRSILCERSELFAYYKLCEKLHRQRDPNIWGGAAAEVEAGRLIDQLEWFEVFDMLEEHVSGPSQEEAVNASFARTGLAYEMVGNEISLYEPEGQELKVSGIEAEAVSAFTGQFKPVARQYDRALGALRGRPADPEKAISEALGALEAVARILGGRQDFGANMNALFANSPEWAKALSASLKALYGYGSQVPGARHGRYTDSLVEMEEALFVVRTCGSAIAYLIAMHRLRRWL
jgi:hypothetical protein